MKGIVHFIAGVATATFFPEAVALAREQNSFILVLGGIFGILPDTLDFKFSRFFEKNDYVIDPHPDSIDAQDIADKIAFAANEALKTQREVKLQLNTVKLGADMWRQYSFRFDTDANEVEVEVGPVVSTSQVPYAGQELVKKQKGRAKVEGKLIDTYNRPTSVDIMSGPSFAFVPRGGGVEALFLPWHRRWSHSVTVGLLVGALGWLALGSIYGIVMGAGFLLHVLCDQLGFMGSNLLPPFTKERTAGFKFFKSMDPMSNFLTFWASAMVIIFNLNRFTPLGSQGEHAFETPWYVYFPLTVILPALLLIFGTRMIAPKEPKEEDVIALAQHEIADENKEEMG